MPAFRVLSKSAKFDSVDFQLRLRPLPALISAMIAGLDHHERGSRDEDVVSPHSPLIFRYACYGSEYGMR